MLKLHFLSMHFLDYYQETQNIMNKCQYSDMHASLKSHLGVICLKKLDFYG